uniref:F-box domain-containing protein n=1 Tax=Aegilops tauschii subsp. strangulata TaxID=200361 RepID=A0A452ZYT0_AEGTS
PSTSTICQSVNRICVRFFHQQNNGHYSARSYARPDQNPTSSAPQILLYRHGRELQDDAVQEILFRCSTACKRWRELVADPSFLRRRWPADAPRSSSIFGFFAPQLLPRSWIIGSHFFLCQMFTINLGHR